jgi:hypothetical protein
MREYWKEVWDELGNLIAPESMAAVIVVALVVLFVFSFTFLLIKLF